MRQLLFAIIIQLTTLVLVGCDGSDIQTSKVIEPFVVTYQVLPSKAQISSYTGVVHARTESHLGFRVPGKVQERMVSSGERVNQGQVLMRLDNADFKLALKMANANIASAQADMAIAKSEERRLAKLVKVNAISAHVYEMAKSILDSSIAKLNSLKANAEKISNQENYTVLIADNNGVILDTFTDVGEIVSAGQRVIDVAYNHQREAIIYLPEHYAGSAPMNASAALYIDPETIYPAKLRELSAVAEPDSRTYRARYTLINDGGDIPLGATVSVTFKEEMDSHFVDIPISAIFDDRNGSSVWLVKKSNNGESYFVTRRAVEVSKLTKSRVQISSGLEVGEKIISMGTHLLRNNQEVRISSSTDLLSMVRAPVVN